VKSREGVLIEPRAGKEAAAKASEARMAGEIDGPRLAPKSGPARQLVVFVHGYGADGNDLIEIGRAWQALLPQRRSSRRTRRGRAAGADGREWFPLTFRNPDERWDGVNMAAPGLAQFPRRGACAASAAAIEARAGRLLAGHHDGAACRAAPRVAPAAIVGYSGMFVLKGDSDVEGYAPQVARVRRCCWCTAIRTSSSRCRRCSMRPRRSPPWSCRSNGIFRPARATGSTPRACAMAGIPRPALPALERMTA
jgi:predicted esterase